VEKAWDFSAGTVMLRLALDQGGHHAASGLEAQGEKGHVEVEELGKLVGT
jgi:hypothetical protein